MQEAFIENGFTLYAAHKEVIILDTSPIAFEKELKNEGLSYDVFTSMADVTNWEVENKRNIYKLYGFPDNDVMYVILEETDDF